MNKKQKGFGLSAALVIVAILLILIGIYAYTKSHDLYKAPEGATTTAPVQATATSTNASTTVIKLTNELTLSIAGSELSLMKGNTALQTITLSDESLGMANSLAGTDAEKALNYFITNLDVNFDGIKDVGVFKAEGYGGVNLFYDFYIFNPKTERFEKNDMLVDIGEPTVIPADKAVRSAYRSGPQWYYVDYVFNGSSYTKSQEYFASSSNDDSEYNWLFARAADDGKLEAPRTQVYLKTKNDQFDAGTYYGTCKVLEKADLQQNEVSGALCWWAGTGDEVGVFEEDGKRVLKHGEQQEGTAEGPGFRGNFKTLQSL